MCRAVLYSCLAMAGLLSEAGALPPLRIEDSTNEDQCVAYYQTGNEFDLQHLLDTTWYVVWLWPPSPRYKNQCEKVTFHRLDFHVINRMFVGCNVSFTPDDLVIQSVYKNIGGHISVATYYGEDEVKTLFRSCENMSKYIFLKINSIYVLGINCSAGARGVLLTSYLPTYEQAKRVVEDIELMIGRDGGSDCRLQ